MKQYSGRLVIRLPQNLHQELAQEAFQSRRSINQLLVESVFLRKMLQKIDPWPGIEKQWQQGKDLDIVQVEADISEALEEVRSTRKKRGSE